MSTHENKIIPSQRFARRQNKEYNVFSTNVENASTVDKWVGLEKPHKVLMDPTSYDQMKNKRIQWVFSKEECGIVACIITES